MQLDEFQAGKHSIAYVSSSFQDKFANETFEPVSDAPTFQTLKEEMSDAKIESTLKPGLCTLGDVVAFMDSAPEECKDGYANLFYFPQCVVFVRWGSGDRGWRVGTWQRGGRAWRAGARVFSPATGRLGAQILSSGALKT